MRDMAPVAMPDDRVSQRSTERPAERSVERSTERAPDTPRQSLAEPRSRPSRIPLHTAHKVSYFSGLDLLITSDWQYSHLAKGYMHTEIDGFMFNSSYSEDIYLEG